VAAAQIVQRGQRAAELTQALDHVAADVASASHNQYVLDVHFHSGNLDHRHSRRERSEVISISSVGVA
jgi:hypothetical protein